MKLQALIEELERQRPLKRDEKTDSSHLKMSLLENQLRFQIKGKDNAFSITNPCHGQIAERLRKEGTSICKSVRRSILHILVI